MNVNLNDKYAVDVLASETGGYVAPPSEYGIAYTNLLFEICAQFGIRYYSDTPKNRYFVEEVIRVTWAKNGKKDENISSDSGSLFCLTQILTQNSNKPHGNNGTLPPKQHPHPSKHRPKRPDTAKFTALHKLRTRRSGVRIP